MVSNSEPLPEGTVIMADNQYAGRGQRENTWHAEPGLNLTFSLFLNPAFLSVDKQYLLNMAVSVGLKDVLSRFSGEGITVKWPNDIYYGDRKMGGILIENSIIGNLYKSAIIGIGINVNQRVFDEERVKTAVSLSEILQRDVNLMVLLAEICGGIEGQYLRLRGNHDDLKHEYLKRLYKYEKRAWFRDGNGAFEGNITDVTQAGQLIIRTAQAMRVYNFKEVEFVRDFK